MKKIYLATPYTSTSKYPRLEQHKRFAKACEIAGEIIKQGHCVFSPIAHSHPIAAICEIPGSHEHWKAQNESWLDWADEIWIGMIPGWKESAGVQWEIDWAIQNGKMVRYI